MNSEDYYDDDDSYHDDNEDLDSAADDWEQEAQEIEEQERAARRAREIQHERQVANRAAKRAAKKEVEAIQPVEVQAEEDVLRTEAAATASAGSVFNESFQYIADMPFRTAKEAEKLGEVITRHILAQRSKDSFKTMVGNLYLSLCKEFSSLDEIASVLNTNNILLEKLKREEKLGKRRAVEESRRIGPQRLELDVSDGRWEGQADDGDADEQPF